MRLRLAAVPGVVLVAVAAAMWGTDPIIRKTMSFSTSATTIVFGEHVFLVALTLPILVPALLALARTSARTIAAVVGIGAGSSALATILFTDALIRTHYSITSVVVQKIQPLVVVLGAAAMLGERPRRRFGMFLLVGLAGFWLVNQPHPLDPSAHGLVAIIEAAAAAVLWGLGTVLGRYAGRELEFQQILSLRFFFGLVASAIAVPVIGTKWYAGPHDSLLMAYLGIVTGLLSLALYYYGLRRTPALLSSLAELTFPAIYVIAGIYGFNQHLDWSQWVGVVVIVGIVTLLPVQRRKQMVELSPRDARLEPAPAAA
jgi:drug/metabolite transporter (DMT)-like permease